jgi:iron only hydrogenase large subunit-like protein
MEDDPRDHSSLSGRIYARTGGVSEAVQKTVQRLQLRDAIPIRALQADGVPACRALMNSLKEGKVEANFLEGMGCVGGCVGGPKAVLDRDTGSLNVNQYGKLALYETPVDNPYVLDILKQLGYKTVESLLDENSMFSRRFE